MNHVNQVKYFRATDYPSLNTFEKNVNYFLKDLSTKDCHFKSMQTFGSGSNHSITTAIYFTGPVQEDVKNNE